MKKINLFHKVFFVNSTKSPVDYTSYYVDIDSGSNDNSGTSPDESFKNITYAISKIESRSNEPAVLYINYGNDDIGNGAGSAGFVLEKYGIIQLTTIRDKLPGPITGRAGEFIERIPVANNLRADRGGIIEKIHIRAISRDNAGRLQNLTNGHAGWHIEINP